MIVENVDGKKRGRETERKEDGQSSIKMFPSVKGEVIFKEVLTRVITVGIIL